MKKTVLIFLLIYILSIFSGCSEKEIVVITDKLNDEQKDNVYGNKDLFVAPDVALAGVSLGDTQEKVISILGNDFLINEVIDDGGYFGQDLKILQYQRGVNITVGKETETVIEIVISDPYIETPRGVKVGDKADYALSKYREEYKEFSSRHSNDILEGWFIIEDGILLILDFDSNDYSRLNSEIESDSQVEEIGLTYAYYFD